MSRKRLIVVGNKQPERNLDEFIDSFDKVIRINNCQYLNEGYGSKTDILYISTWWLKDEQWSGLKEKFGNRTDKFILMQEKHVNTPEGREALLKAFQPTTFDSNFTVDIYSYFDNTPQSFTTSTITITQWAIDNFSEEYDIYLTGIDKDCRQVLMQNNQHIWGRIGGFHESSANKEEQIINNWIENKQVTFIESDLEIPIIITVKETSLRCPNKNKKLLGFSYNYLKKTNNLDKTVVITDTNDMKSYCEKIGFNNIVVENRTTEWCELTSLYNYIKDKNINYCYLFQVTQPFKELDLINRMYKQHKCNIYNKEKIDFIVSSSKVADRNIFYYDGRFEYQSIEGRKGSLCCSHNMIDGSVYLISKECLERVNNQPLHKQNIEFWNNSKIQTIDNNVPFIDIDTPEDLLKLNNLFKLFAK